MMYFAASDPLIWTPSAVASELSRILGVLDIVNGDVSAASGAGKITNAEWNTWRAFYLSTHDFLTTASHLWGSNVNTARQYEQEMGKWRDLVKSRGQAVQGPSDIIRNDPDKNPSGVSWWTIGLFVGAAGAGAWLYYRLSKKVLS